MLKLLSATLPLFVILISTRPGNLLTKYKSVEAYEVRPGILVFPRYAEDAQICEVGIEKRHYWGEKVTLDYTMSRGEIDAVVDELVPASERGPRSNSSIDGFNTITGIGHAMRQIEDYENVTVRLEGESRGSGNDTTVVILTWKGRLCK